MKRHLWLLWLYILVMLAGCTVQTTDYIVESESVPGWVDLTGRGMVIVLGSVT